MNDDKMEQENRELEAKIATVKWYQAALNRKAVIFPPERERLEAAVRAVFCESTANDLIQALDLQQQKFYHANRRIDG